MCGRCTVADLPPLKAYFGSERIFGRGVLDHDDTGTAFEGLPLIGTVSVAEPDEPGMLRPAKAADRGAFEVEVPDSLKEAIQYFLATACRYARGQDGEHSSMLVHTSQYVAIHMKTQAAIAEFVDEVRKAVEGGRDASLRDLWMREMSNMSHLAEGQTVAYDKVRACLPLVFKRCAVVVDNGLLGSQLIYPRKSANDPRVYIAVGGNTLSRGLTLDGLVGSYFIRVASAYDLSGETQKAFGVAERARGGLVSCRAHTAPC
jgi:hypothetical protein